jgi:hypothetical protein
MISVLTVVRASANKLLRNQPMSPPVRTGAGRAAMD